MINNETLYWYQVQQAAITTKYFRFHVSGDIPDAHYLDMMLATAEIIPTTKFLVFTKKYNIVNHAIDSGVYIPDNIKIIFSEWGNEPIPNPHKLPTAAIIFRGQAPKPEYKICGGNCAECACQGVGCWEIKNGETIAFYEH